MTDSVTQPDEETAPPVPVVAIGASAGGLEQIKLLLRHMPVDTGAAFVVVQHLDPSHESHMADLLAQICDLDTVTMADGMAIQANRVHILPSGYRAELDSGGVFRLTASKARHAKPTLIDHFLRSLAAAWGRHAVGVIVSGSGNDGALGLKAVRGGGGLAIAQTPETAEFDGMPRAAASYASPDCLLDTEDMIETLRNHLSLNLAERSLPEQAPSDDDETVGDQTLTDILETLYEHTNYDFRHHKPNMLKRRSRRRMALSGYDDTDTYLRALRTDGEERQHLCDDFLISVTDFFREPESYDELNRLAIQPLLKNRSVDNAIRVWVPGCATGEEAYSIAMLLAEAIEASGKNYKYVVFATDIDENALAAARAGLYPESIEADLSNERLRAFFNKVDDRYQVRRSLREHVVFAPQSVTDDPPYSRLDLLSCRNLLIYLTAATQERLVTLFHFALKETGYLFLGGSETVGRQTDLFEPASREHRIYRRLATSRRYQVQFPTPHGSHESAAPAQTNYQQRHETPRPQDPEQIGRDILLGEYVPASVLVDRNLEILASYGPTRAYLSLPLGESSLGLLEMVHEEYRSHVRAVTYRALRYEETNDVTAKIADGDGHALVVSARPLQHSRQTRGLMLVTFEQRAETGGAQLEGLSHGDLQQQLSDELDATRSELHGTIAALEESNEDLKGSNEEIMSMNEELQSTNEELETSKEELQSVNEELTTVNTELENKVAELESANDDLNNLFYGTRMATLFLDREMRIKRFTPATRDLLSLISTDTGRPLEDITCKFADPNLLAEAHRVLDELTPRDAEVQTTDGRWYQRRILPYRTGDDVIGGVVINFAEITELKNAMLAARKHKAQLDLAVSALSGGMWEMAIDPEAPDQLPDAIHLSPRLKRLIGFSDEQLPNTLGAWSERIVDEDRAAYTDLARRRDSDGGQPLHYRIRHRDGSLRWLVSHGRMFTDEQGHATRWIGIDCEITEAKQGELQNSDVRERLQLLADALPELVCFVDTDNTIQWANAAFNEWFGGDKDELAGRGLAEVLGETLTGSSETALTGQAVNRLVELASDNRGQRHFEASHLPHVVDGEVKGYYLLMRDTAARDEPAADRPDEQTKLVHVQRMAMIGEMASTLAHDLKQPLSAINSYAGGLTRQLYNGKPADETVPIVRKIADQVERTSGIVDGVRGLVGRSGDGDTAIDLNTLLNDAVHLTSNRALKYDVDMNVSEHTPLPDINGDNARIQQVLVNLINNAMEAMQDTDSGERKLWLSTAAPDGGYVQVTVTDSGPGIAPGKLESIFESFQSTKLEGMGMGLAISRSIAQWHGGNLWAESQPGHGATFILSLPVAEPESESA